MTSDLDGDVVVARQGHPGLPPGRWQIVAHAVEGDDLGPDGWAYGVAQEGPVWSSGWWPSPRVARRLALLPEEAAVELTARIAGGPLGQWWYR